MNINRKRRAQVRDSVTTNRIFVPGSSTGAGLDSVVSKNKHSFLRHYLQLPIPLALRYLTRCGMNTIGQVEDVLLVN